MKNEQIKQRLIILPGMSRTGTTFIYHNLEKHPQIFLPVRKEIGYFSHYYSKNVNWYYSFFNEINKTQKAMDICGVYFTVPESFERIVEFNENAKIIIGVRDPYTWAYSFYEQYKINFNIKNSIIFTTYHSYYI